MQQGLTQHLEASHDLFVYGYPKDSNALPVVSLEPREDIYNASSAFQDPEAKNMRDPVNKVLILHMSSPDIPMHVGRISNLSFVSSELVLATIAARYLLILQL